MRPGPLDSDRGRPSTTVHPHRTRKPGWPTRAPLPLPAAVSPLVAEAVQAPPLAPPGSWRRSHRALPRPRRARAGPAVLAADALRPPHRPPARPCRRPLVAWGVEPGAHVVVGGGRVHLPAPRRRRGPRVAPARVAAAAQPLVPGAGPLDRSPGPCPEAGCPARADRRRHPCCPRRARPGRSAARPTPRPRRRRPRPHPERRRRPVRGPARPARGRRPCPGARGPQRRRDAVAGRHHQPVRLPALAAARGHAVPDVARLMAERGRPGRRRDRYQTPASGPAVLAIGDIAPVLDLLAGLVGALRSVIADHPPHRTPGRSPPCLTTSSCAPAPTTTP